MNIHVHYLYIKYKCIHAQYTIYLGIHGGWKDIYCLCIEDLAS